MNKGETDNDEEEDEDVNEDKLDMYNQLNIGGGSRNRGSGVGG